MLRCTNISRINGVVWCYLFTPSILLLQAGCDGDGPLFPEPPPLANNYTLSSSTSVPEGIGFDPLERSFYVTGLGDGSITRIASDGTETIFRAADNNAELLGTKVDAQRRMLWVCAGFRDAPMEDSILGYDLQSGSLLHDISLSSAASGAQCNDLTVANDGSVYVTDPSNANIYLIPAAVQQAEIFVSDPLLQPLVVGLGSNGIAISEDQTTLLVGKFIPASFLAIDLSAATITTVTLSGEPVLSPDGLIFLDARLYSVSDRAVQQLTFTGNFSAASVNQVDLEPGLSTATVAEGQLYVIRSFVTSFVLNQPIDQPFEIERVDSVLF